MLRRALVFAVLALCIQPVRAEGLPPVEVFGALPVLSDIKLSPDGTHMAALQTLKGRKVVAIYTIGAPRGTVPAVLADDELRHFVDFRWVSSERLLVTAYSSLMMPQIVMISVDTDAKNQVVLPVSAITGLDLADKDHIYIADFAGGWGARLDLFKLDIAKGSRETVVEGKSYRNGLSHTISFVMDGHGGVVARIDHDDDPIVDRVRVYRQGSWDDAFVYAAEPNHGAHIVALSQDGTKLVHFERNAQTGTDGLATYDLASGKREPLYWNSTYDLQQMIVSEWDERALGAIYVADRYAVHYFDPELQGMQTQLEAQYPEKSVVIISMDAARNRIVYRVSGPSEPQAYYFLDRTLKATARIGSAYPALHPQDLGPVRAYSYKARDGLDIHAYLTLPPGKEPKNLPLIVMPHGGPELRDAMDFDWWAQFLANRGYAVLQPNFRGSSGYGYAFSQAGFQQWGLKMQDDISGGVNKAVADGIADPSRVCIVGASYGGYAALAGATFTPGLYACAVSYAGVSNLSVFGQRSGHSEVGAYWTSRLGDSFEDRVRLKATSPALHADQVRCPILLIHGEGDVTVEPHQSKEMYDKLKAAGKDVEYIKLTGEDHYLVQSETRTEMLTAIASFLEKHIGH